MATLRIAPYVLFLGALPLVARAEDPPLPEAPLGTVDVTGAGGGIVLQRLAVVMRPSHRDGDTALQRITRNDLQLSGQFEVYADGKAPAELAEKEGEVDLAPFGALGADVVVRVGSEDTGEVTELTGQIYFPKSGKKAPAFTRSILGPKGASRLAAHRLSDAVLGALSGHAGAFASQLTFVARAGTGQQVFVADADGFAPHPYGPAGQVALSPDFGPGGSVYYALSKDRSPFRFTEGESAQPVSWPIVKGNVLGLAFAPDRQTLALTVAGGLKSEILLRGPDGTTHTLQSPPNAHHPAFGPQNKLAWVAGDPPRVLVEGTPISPAGIPASSPTFCDSPQGLLVVFSLASGKDSAIYTTDTKGNGLRRLTSTGRDDSPACSADGRLVAYFSRRAQNPGLYVMPILLPGRTQRILPDVGSALRWGRPEKGAEKGL